MATQTTQVFKKERDNMLIVKIQNDGKGTNEDSSYNYEVFVNNEMISHGRVFHHNREDGWAKLVKAVAENEINYIEDIRRIYRMIEKDFETWVKEGRP